MPAGLTLITLLRVPYLGRIGSTKLVLPKWHKYGTLNRVIRVRSLKRVKIYWTKTGAFTSQLDMKFSNVQYAFYFSTVA